MLPKRPSTNDFYPCGPRVQIPSIRVSNKPKIRQKSGPEFATTAPRNGLMRRHTVGDVKSCLRSRVGELKQTMTFTDDVISSITPQTMSYRQAREELSRVFHCSTAPNKSRQLRFPELSERELGRHNCRGAGRKHPLCHLPSSFDRQKHYQPPISHHKTVEHDGPSNNSVCITSYPSNMLYRRIKTVAASKSVQWEEQTLNKMTSSTAIRFRGRDQETRETERMEMNNSRKNEDKDEMDVEMSREEMDYMTSLKHGARPVWTKEKKDIILLDNDTTFTKVLQSSYPVTHNEWCEREQDDEDKDEWLVKGGRRWIDLPTPAPIPERLQWIASTHTTSSEHNDIEPSSLTSINISSVQWNYCNIMAEWSSQHSLHVQPDDMCISNILHNIHSHNDTTKLRGIVACSCLVQYLLKQNETIDLESCGEIVKELINVLNDECISVRIIAAIALHCLGGQENTTAVDVLLDAVQSESCDVIDKWAGLQCLVESGVCEVCVVEGLQKYLLNSSQSSRRERAGQLMAKLSDRMPLVHALLAEQLTSRGWNERLSACLILPTLLCPLSVDVCSRLVVMTWEDWSSEVRDTASQALGKTGHGKLLHDELVRRLNEGVEIERLDALKKLQHLQLMTPQLLAAFLPSFSDQHASIRLEAIVICDRLAVRDNAVLQQLIHLLGDPIWTIRAHTLKALTSIGCYDDDIIEQILWTVRCDKIPAVRAEACHALCHLWKKMKYEESDDKGNDRIITALRERLVVEDNAMVTRELTTALRDLGGNIDKSDPLLNYIQTEVERLGTNEAIKQGILKNEQDLMTDYIINRPLNHLTTRDYLTQHHRHKFYSDKTTHPITNNMESSTVRRVWSPDRQLIDGKLASIGKMCSLPKIS